MNKHTPGPWKTQREHSGGWEVVDAEQNLVVELVGLKNGTANATLIAAAPEMLEALRKMVEAVTVWRTTGAPDLGDIATAHDAAIAAIARVTGVA